MLFPRKNIAQASTKTISYEDYNAIENAMYNLGIITIQKCKKNKPNLVGIIFEQEITNDEMATEKRE